MVEIPIRKRTDFMLLSADSVDFEEKIGNLSDREIIKTGAVKRREICANNSKILKILRSFFK